MSGYNITYIFRKFAIVAATVILYALPVSAAPFVVVIDPGHGGKDFGAIGAKTNEKTIVLAVGRLLGKKISQAFGSDDVKIVFTRDNDTFVTLQGRADIANKAKGDLFISIHANSVDKRNRNRKQINGTSVYTLGVNRTAKNLAVAQRENSVIVLESDYTVRYQGFDPSSAESYIIFELEQNRHMVQSLDFASKAQTELVRTAGRTDKKVRQAGFWVLHATSMPAVLVELDFICNPTEEAFMASGKGQEKLATALFNAFVSYKKSYDAKTGTPSTATEAVATTEPETLDAVGTPPECSEYTGITLYCVQFLTSKSILRNGDSKFKGIRDASFYSDSGLFKYYCGATEDFADAKKRLKEVRKSFPDAFIIRMKDGKRLK